MKRISSLLLCSAALLAWAVAAPARAAVGRVQSQQKSLLAVEGQVIVKYRPGQKSSGLSRLQSMGGASQFTIGNTDAELVSVPAGYSTSEFLAMLQADPHVEYAEANGIVQKFAFPDDADPNDPNYPGSQYYLGTSFTNAPAAWRITLGAPTTVVAVLDTGVFLTHPDISSNLWTNPSPSGSSGLRGTTLMIDWNNDNDCLDTDPTVGPEQCASNDPTDNEAPEYHGTRVAGIISATTNNGLNMASVAPQVRIMAVKVLNSDGFGTFASIANGISYAANNGASVINMSLGGSDSSQVVINAVNDAFNKNVVIVAASGNSGNSFPVNFPANISRVIAVGSVNSSRALSSFSCTGNELDLVAPGESILSLAPPAGSNAVIGDGTSFSSPQVAGVAALIRSIKPQMSVDEVTRYINFTASDLGAPGFDTRFGFGLLNAAAAVQSAQEGRIFVSNPGDSGDTYPYPNPYYPATGLSVSFSLPASLGSSGIEITIYNTAGQEVKKLNGTTQWDGKNESGASVASGLYFYLAKTNSGEAKGKITVIR